MSLESNIAELVQASNALTGTVNGKIADIDRRVDVNIQKMEDWRKENTPERRIVIDFTIGGSKDFFYPVWWRFQSAGMSESIRYPSFVIMRGMAPRRSGR